MIVVRLYGFGFVRDYLFLLKAKHRNSNGNVSPLPPPPPPPRTKALETMFLAWSILRMLPWSRITKNRRSKVNSQAGLCLRSYTAVGAAPGSCALFYMKQRPMVQQKQTCITVQREILKHLRWQHKLFEREREGELRMVSNSSCICSNARVRSRLQLRKTINAVNISSLLYILFVCFFFLFSCRILRE